MDTRTSRCLSEHCMAVAVVSAPPPDLFHGLHDIFGGCGLLFHWRGNALGLPIGLFEGSTRLLGIVPALFYRRFGLFHSGHRDQGRLLDGLDGRSDIFGRAHGFFRQLTHFVGHHGKSPSRIPCPDRLDGRVQGQKIGLVGDVVDHGHDLSDIPDLFIQLLKAGFELGGLRGFMRPNKG